MKPSFKLFLVGLGCLGIAATLLCNAQTSFTVPTQKTPAGGVTPRTTTLLPMTTITAQTTVWNLTTSIVGLTSSSQHSLGLWSDVTATNYSNLGAAAVTNVWDFAYDPRGTNFTTNALQVITTCNGTSRTVWNTNLLQYQFDNATALRLTKTLVSPAAIGTTNGLAESQNLNTTP